MRHDSYFVLTQFLCWFVPSSQVLMDRELVVWNMTQTWLFWVDQTRHFWVVQIRHLWMDQTRLFTMGRSWLLTMFPALPGLSSSALASIFFLQLDSLWWVRKPEVSKLLLFLCSSYQAPNAHLQWRQECGQKEECQRVQRNSLFKDTTTICKKRLKSRFSIIGDYLSTWVRCIYKFSLVDRPSFQVSFFGESDYDSCSWRHQIQFLMDWSKTFYMANLENGYVLLTLKYKSDI